jgi:PTH1 family peptidyl-tRNA hydrolase
MIIIAGLGNPGKEYENTPHNLGFEAIDEFAKKNNFPVFEFDKYSNALISKKDNVILAKPQSFMNNSGFAIKKLAEAFLPLTSGRKASAIFIVHDDIDLALGTYKVSANRGSAGHKGVESIMRELGTEDFTRIRIGVSKEKKPDVLKKFSKKDKEILKQTFNQISLELEKSIKQ